MPLTFLEGEACPHGQTCPYNEGGTCFGARRDRLTKFTCEYVQGNKIVEGGVQRNPHDVTGKMKVLTEQI